MKYWNEAPLVRILPPFLSGIICGLYFEIPIVKTFICITLLTLILWIILKRLRWKYNIRWLFGATIHFLLILTGWYLTNNFCEIKKEYHFSKFFNSGQILFIHLDEQPHEKFSSI